MSVDGFRSFFSETLFVCSLKVPFQIEPYPYFWAGVISKILVKDYDCLHKNGGAGNSAALFVCVFLVFWYLSKEFYLLYGLALAGSVEFII